MFYFYGILWEDCNIYIDSEEPWVVEVIVNKKKNERMWCAMHFSLVMKELMPPNAESAADRHLVVDCLWISPQLEEPSSPKLCPLSKVVYWSSLVYQGLPSPLSLFGTTLKGCLSQSSGWDLHWYCITVQLLLLLNSASSFSLPHILIPRGIPNKTLHMLISILGFSSPGNTTHTRTFSFRFQNLFIIKL